MADDRPSLSIDTDWKKQAQEEKRKLAEEAKKRQEQSASDGVAGRIGPAGASPASSPAGAPAGARPGAPRSSQPRELPPASFATLIQSIVTQVLFYLGDLAGRGAAPVVNLDMAKHNVDILGMIEEKTRGNLDKEEQKLLDAALYEARMRYVNIASQYIG